MATIVEKRSVASVRYDLGRNSGLQSASRQIIVGADLIPDKVSGRVITYPDGSTFRKATEYSRFHTSLELGSSQNTRAKNLEPLWLGNSAYLNSSAGGYQPDDIYTFAQFNALKSVGIGNVRAPLGAITGSDYNQAVTKALLELGADHAQLGESLGQLKQTLRMFTAPVAALTRGIRFVHSKPNWWRFLRQSERQIRRAGPLSIAAREYLKYVYGWIPLMSDIHTLSELAKPLAASPLLLRGSYNVVTAPTHSAYTYVNPSNVCTTTLGPLSVKDRTSCTIWAQVDPEYAGTRALNQLGLVNPLSIAWELTPFSFVIDWLLPIGSVLRALSAPAGLKFVDCSVARRFTAVGPVSHHNDSFDKSYPKYEKLGDSSGTSTFRYDAYRREIRGTWPTPGLWIDYDMLRGDRPLKALALGVLGPKSLK